MIPARKSTCVKFQSFHQSQATLPGLIHPVSATREGEELHVGVSTRGALCLYRASQALALVENRDFVVPDDVKRLAVAVLSHRIIAKGYLGGGQRQAVESLVRRLVEDVPVPS